jgi:hypothetical protein
LEGLVGPQREHSSWRYLATLTSPITTSALLAEVLFEFGTEGLDKAVSVAGCNTIAYYISMGKHTSSLFDCLPLAVLWLAVLASLWMDSSFGLGMFDVATEGLSE